MFDTELYTLTLLANIIESNTECTPFLANIAIIDSTELSSQTIFIDYLVTLFLSETSSMIKDLEESEIIINNNNKNSINLSQNNQINENLQTKIDEKSNNNNSNNNNSNNSNTMNERLPVAEIIMSAHLCLLIISIVSSEFKLNEFNTQNNTQSNSYCMKYNVKSKLPRNSWWLAIRILKAFIVLQDKVSHS